MVTSEGELKEAIGGYFELELSKGEHYHKGALRLNTALVTMHSDITTFS